MDNRKIMEYKVQGARNELEFVKNRILNADEVEIINIKDVTRIIRMLDDVDRKLEKNNYVELTDIKDEISTLAYNLKKKVLKKKKQLKKDKYSKTTKLQSTSIG